MLSDYEQFRKLYLLQKGEGPRSNYDYEDYAPTSTIDLNQGLGSFNFGDVMSGLNPMGLSPTQRGITAVLGPMGLFGSLAYNAYKNAQEKAANMAEAREITNRLNRETAERSGNGGGFSTQGGPYGSGAGGLHDY